MKMRDCPSECGTVDTYAIAVTRRLIIRRSVDMVNEKIGGILRFFRDHSVFAMIHTS